MKSIAFAVLAAVGLLAWPALAQTPAAPAPVTNGTQVSLQSLLAAGYEVKSVMDLTDDEQKILWPSSSVAPYVLVTLQKGASLAVCNVSMAGWVAMHSSLMDLTTACYQR